MSSPNIERSSVQAPPVGDAPMAPPAPPAGRIVDGPVTGAAAPVSSRRVASFTRITPARIITAAAGTVLLVIGLIAVAKAGLAGPLDEPVVKVAGMTHTAPLGIIGAVAGLLLLGAAVLGTDAGSRSWSTFYGALLGIAGIVAIATPESFRSLAVQSSFGWMLLIIGGSVVAANLLLPTITARKVTYR